MDDTQKQYRRDLLISAISYGAVSTAINEGRDDYGTSCVLIVACAKSEPGRSFFNRLSRCRPASASLQREVREATADGRAIVTAMPAEPFASVADEIAPTLRSAMRDLMGKRGVMPVVMMGAGGVMTAGIGETPDVLDSVKACDGRAWAVASGSQSPAEDERERRRNRKRHHGMN